MTMPMGSFPVNNDNETVQAKTAEIRQRGLEIDAMIQGLAEAEIALANKNKTIDDLRNAHWQSGRALAAFKEDVIRSLMSNDIGEYLRECIFYDLGLEMPSLRWRISFDVEIEYGTDIDDVATDAESFIGRIDGVQNVAYENSQEA